MLRRLALTAVALLLPTVALAQGDFGLTKAFQGLDSSKQAAFAKSVPLIIARVIDIALGFVGILFFLLLLYAGFLWMTARGSQEGIKKAKDIMAAAIIGLVIITGAFSITRIIFRTVSQPAPISSCAECDEDETCVDVEVDGRKFPACQPKLLATGKTCGRDFQCASGKCEGGQDGTCKTGGTPCWWASDCATGDTCGGGKNGKCSEGETVGEQPASGGTVSPEPLACPQGKACKNDGDCAGTGKIGSCKSGACECAPIQKCTRGSLCVDDAQCSQGGICGPPCAFNRGVYTCSCSCLQTDDIAPPGKCSPACADIQECHYGANGVFFCE